MSLDARFTQLRRSGSWSRQPAGPRVYVHNNPTPRERLSLLSNRLLAMEMGDRPNVMAALSRGGRPRARRGSFSGAIAALGVSRARSPFPRARSRSRQRAAPAPAPLRRSSSVGRLQQRSQSVQSLMSLGSESSYNFGGAGRRGGGRGGRGGFRSRVFTRGSRISARGGIQKLNMDLVGAARRRRSASLSRLGNIRNTGLRTAGGGGAVRAFRRGRGNRAASVGAGSVKSRLGVRPASASLPRSQSLTTLKTKRVRGGGRGGSRGGARGATRNLIATRGGARRGGVANRGVRTNRGRANARGAVRGAGKGNRQSAKPGFRGRGGQRGAGRGARGGRGRGGRGGGQKKTPPPTKESLDQELDQYMSTTKSYLDKQLDSYMSQPTASA